MSQGLDATRLLRGRALRFPRLHVPPATVQEQVWRPVRQLPPGSQRRRAQANAAGSPPLAPAPAPGQDPHRPGADLPSDHPGLDQLLRALLPLGVEEGPQAYQGIPRALGPVQVQTTAPHPPRRADSWSTSSNANPTCSPTGGFDVRPTAGRWEPGERRRSRRVLREPWGETPPGHSPDGGLWPGWERSPDKRVAASPELSEALRGVGGAGAAARGRPASRIVERLRA
jgi:hypothetical protein